MAKLKAIEKGFEPQPFTEFKYGTCLLPPAEIISRGQLSVFLIGSCVHRNNQIIIIIRICSKLLQSSKKHECEKKEGRRLIFFG